MVGGAFTGVAIENWCVSVPDMLLLSFRVQGYFCLTELYVDVCEQSGTRSHPHRKG